MKPLKYWTYLETVFFLGIATGMELIVWVHHGPVPEAFVVAPLIWGWQPEGLGNHSTVRLRDWEHSWDLVFFCLYIIWLDWNMNFMTFHSIGNVIIPTDFHIFQRGRYTTNQIMFMFFLSDITCSCRNPFDIAGFIITILVLIP
jgi:hypothetical protein